MQFFPHRTTLGVIGQATTASRSAYAELINNFSTIPVDTASIALNITGSTGLAGSNFTAIGPQGPQGTQGPRGPRGDHVYLLSVAWDQAPPEEEEICYELTPVGTSTFNDPDYSCDFGTTVSYYSTSSILTDGTVLYYDSGCSSLAINMSGLAWSGYGAFGTNGSGVVENNGVCGVEF